MIQNDLVYILSLLQSFYWIEIISEKNESSLRMNATLTFEFIFVIRIANAFS